MRSLATKLVIYILLFSSLLTLVIASFQIYRDYRNELDSLKESVKQIESVHLQSLAASVWNFDENQIDNIIHGIMAVPNVAYVEVKDPGSRTFHKQGTRPTSDFIEQLIPVTREKSGTRIAELTIVASLEGINRSLKEKVFFILFSKAFEILIVSMVIIFLFKFFITDHLKRIATMLQGSGRDLFSSGIVELKISKNHVGDELDVVVSSFNNLFRELDHSYREIANFSEGLERKIEERTLELNRTQHEIREMLDNIEHGVFTFDADLEINEHYSQSLVGIMGDAEPENKDALQFLFRNSRLDEKQVRLVSSSVKLAFGESLFNWELVEVVFPNEMMMMADGKTKTIHFKFQAICDESRCVQRILVVLTDVTEVKELRRQTEEKNRQLERIAHLVSIKDNIFAQFHSETIEQLEECDTLLDALRKDNPSANDATVFFRNIHTIKGNSRLFNFSTIHDQAEKVEDIAHGKDLHVIPTLVPRVKEHLVNIRSELRTYSDMRKEIFSRYLNLREENVASFKWIKAFTRDLICGLSGIAYKTLIETGLFGKIETLISNVNKASLHDYLGYYSEMINSIASKFQKKIKPLQMDIKYGFFEEDTLSKINNVLVHLIRNCVDHGIESPETRVSWGKPEDGMIEIRSEFRNNRVYISVSDDGRGVDPDGVAEIAVQKGVKTQSDIDAMTAGEKVDLIFAPGFSTAQEVTSISGRGVGLDAARATIQSLGGKISVASKPWAGSQFLISLPPYFDSDLNSFVLMDFNLLCSNIIAVFKEAYKNAQISFQVNGPERKNIYSIHDILAYALRKFLVSVTEFTSPSFVSFSIDEFRDPDVSGICYRFEVLIDKQIPADVVVLHELEILLQRINIRVSIHDRILRFVVPAYIPTAIEKLKFQVGVLSVAELAIRKTVKEYLAQSFGCRNVEFFARDRVSEMLRSDALNVIFLDHSVDVGSLRPVLEELRARNAYFVLFSYPESIGITEKFLPRETILMFAPVREFLITRAIDTAIKKQSQSGNPKPDLLVSKVS